MAACGDHNDSEPLAEGSTTGEVASTGSTGIETSSSSDTAGESSSSSSSSSGGDTESWDGFVPPEGVSLQEVVVNQGVAIPVWTAADGVIEVDERSAPLLQNRGAAVFARFSVENEWEPREVTARLRWGEQTLETVLLVTESSTDDPRTWFGWMLEAQDVAAGVDFQVELVEPAAEPSEVEPVAAPVDRAAPVGFQGPELELNLVMMPITIESETCNETREPPESEQELVYEYLLQSLPLQAVNLSVHDRPATVQLQEPGDYSSILDALVETRVADEVPNTTYVVGIPPSCAGPFNSGLYRGATGETLRHTGMVIPNTEFLTKNLGFLVALMNERRIVDCPERPVSNPDPDYPYADGLIGTWGFGILDHQLHSPLEDHSVISNCSPSWVSDYGWAVTYEELKFLNGF